jgi:CheY-like chemotaxis protein
MSQLPRRTDPSAPCITVLVVDDEALIRTLVSRWLIGSRYAVFEAASGRGALEVLSDPLRPVDLLITDLAMPGMNGTELIAWTLANRPELPILCMTGHAEGVPPGIPVIDKPFRAPAFLDAVTATLAAGPVKRRRAATV